MEIKVSLKTTGPFVARHDRPIAEAGVLTLPAQWRRWYADVIASIGNSDFDTDVPDPH